MYVTAETRIAPTALCPTAKDGKKYSSRVYFRPEENQSDSDWFMWRSGEGRGKELSIDAISTDDRNAWSNAFANIYRDYCIYDGDDHSGYKRCKGRVVAVKGIMLDFDSHTNTDMPLQEIGAIIESPAFAEAVPCSRILMTGGGYQEHFAIAQDIASDEPEHQSQIAEFEATIQSLMEYFRVVWKLTPDIACKDITRLHRHYPSNNTKKMEMFRDNANRIPVRLLLDRTVDADKVKSFIDTIKGQYPVAPEQPRNTVVFVDKSGTFGDKKDKALEPPCVKALWEQGSAEGHRNADRFALLSRLHSCGFDENEALEAALEFNDKCQPPDDVTSITTHVRSFYRTPKQCGCKYFKETVGTCPYADKTEEEIKALCPLFLSAHNKISHPYFLSDQGTVMRREYKAEKDGEIVEDAVSVTESGYMVVTSVIQDTEGKMYGGKIVNGGWSMPFELPASLWANRLKFAERIKGIGGEKIIFASRNVEHLAMAAELLQPNKTIRVVADFGWNSDYTEYYGVDCVIDKQGIHPPSDQFFKCPNDSVKRLRLEIPESNDEVVRIIQHIRTDLMHFNNFDVMQYVLGTVFIAPFASILRRKANTTNAVPSLILQGTTGTGKTAALLLGASFFGQVRECDLVSFGSTCRFVNDLGYFFKDCLYVMDDLKWGSLQQSVQGQVVGMLQSYVDGHGRNRLSSKGGEWEPSTGKEIRGTVCIAAEDLPSGEASVFGRYMIVHMTATDLNADLYGRCLKESRHYSKVMSAFIFWYLNVPNHHDELLAKFDSFRKLLEQNVPKERVNLIRVCSQLALNQVGYHMFLSFAKNLAIFTGDEVDLLLADHHQRLLLFRDQRLVQIAGETPVEKFLLMVASLLSSGKVRLDGDGGEYDHPVIIGFEEHDTELDKDILYLDPSMAFGQVQRAYADMGEKIPFGQHSLGQQLNAHGYLARKDPDRMTVMKRRNRRKARYYAIDLTKFDFKAQEDESLSQIIDVDTPAEQPEEVSPVPIGDTLGDPTEEDSNDDWI